jgi:chromosome segregation ATPase
MKKKENEPQAKPSLQEEVASLKRQLAGSKGRNKQLAEENKALKSNAYHLEKEVERLNDAIKATHCLVDSCKTELYETKEKLIKLKDIEAMVEWYNELPLWKKVFVKRIETY